MSSTLKQAVILAAGTGTRLRPITDSVPKCMVPVGDRTIVDRLVEAILPLGVEELLFVTGHCDSALQRHLGHSVAGVPVSYVFNERYQTTNNILSVDIAADQIKAPFALLESDVVVRQDLLSSLATPDTMLLAPYLPHMDGTGVTLGPDGTVTEMVIRAHLARPDRLGELHKTVNFYSFSEATWTLYRARLRSWVVAERLDQYYEAVLAELIAEGLRLRGVDVGVEGWAEVDDAADLERASALF